MVGKKGYWKDKKFSLKHRLKISLSKKGKHSSIKTEFKQGHKFSKKTLKLISIKTKEAMKNPKIKKKLSKIMKKRIKNGYGKILSQLAKRRKHTIAERKYMSKIMTGRAIKWLKGKPSNSKGRKLSQEQKTKISQAIQKHHIDLNKQNNKKNNILYLNSTIHQKLHHYGYRYLVFTGQIKKFMKWFEKLVGIKLKLEQIKLTKGGNNV